MLQYQHCNIFSSLGVFFSFRVFRATVVAVVLRRKRYLMAGAQEGEVSSRCLRTLGLHFTECFIKADRFLGYINQAAQCRLLVWGGEEEFSSSLVDIMLLIF